MCVVVVHYNSIQKKGVLNFTAVTVFFSDKKERKM